MIRLAHGDDVPPASVGPGQPQREIDRLGAAVDEEHRVQRIGQQGGEALGELDDGAVMEAGVRVEQAPLPLDRVRQARVAMAKDRHVVEHVEVRPAVDVEQVVPPAALDLGRRGEVVLLDRRKRRVSTRQEPFFS